MTLWEVVLVEPWNYQTKDMITIHFTKLMNEPIYILDTDEVGAK